MVPVYTFWRKWYYCNTAVVKSAILERWGKKGRCCWVFGGREGGLCWVPEREKQGSAYHLQTSNFCTKEWQHLQTRWHLNIRVFHILLGYLCPLFLTVLCRLQINSCEPRLAFIPLATLPLVPSQLIVEDRMKDGCHEHIDNRQLLQYYHCLCQAAG